MFSSWPSKDLFFIFALFLFFILFMGCLFYSFFHNEINFCSVPPRLPSFLTVSFYVTWLSWDSLWRRGWSICLHLLSSGIKNVGYHMWKLFIFWILTIDLCFFFHQFYGYLLFCFTYFFVWDRVSCMPGEPQNHCVDKDDLEFLFFLLLLMSFRIP